LITLLWLVAQAAVDITMALAVVLVDFLPALLSKLLKVLTTP
jgi:hypothetical protein